MTKAPTTFLTPFRTSDLAEGDGGKSFWKEMLPETSIEYNDGKSTQTLDFDRDYQSDLLTAYDEGALDQVPFMLADESNRHTMDPERYRGDVVAFKRADELPEAITHGKKTGLWGKVKFATKDAAKAVMENPNLGVSLRIREGHTRAVDGKKFKRVVVHALGTLDPKITGMSGWTPALEFSGYAPNEQVVDLTTSTYKEPAVSKKSKTGSQTLDFATLTDEAVKALTPSDISDWTAEDFEALDALDEDERTNVIANLSDESIEAFIAQTVTSGYLTQAELDAQLEAGAEDEDDETPPAVVTPARPTQTATTQEPDLSNSSRDVELANARADQATQTARDALQRVADAEFERLSQNYLLAGVPSWAVDLATPVLRRPYELEVDLSNSGEDNIPVTAIITGLLDGLKGTVDMSNEAGHGGATPAEEAELANMDKQFDADFGYLNQL